MSTITMWILIITQNTEICYCHETTAISLTSKSQQLNFFIMTKVHIILTSVVVTNYIPDFIQELDVLV